jgi:hemerythrin-like domain-containing protein
MNMVGIQIGAKPDSGFDDPIGMLTDCHRRIESFLHVLCLVADRARGKSLSEEEAAAVTSALNYFRAGGKRHTADEEESLFPRLRGVSTGTALEELDRLEGDHERANELHEAVENLFLKWIESGWLVKDDDQMLQDATAELECIYKVHIKVEEEEVFPEAARTLDKKAVDAMGQEFRARRA